MALNNRGGISPRRDQVDLFGRMNTSTNGTITTQTKRRYSGFTVAKTGTAQYTLTVDKVANRLAEMIALQATLIGTFAAGRGLVPLVTTDYNTTTGAVVVTFVNDAGAITGELPDGVSVMWNLIGSTSVAQVG